MLAWPKAKREMVQRESQEPALEGETDKEELT